MRILVFLAVLAAGACASQGGSGQAGDALLDRDWQLVAEGEPPAPIAATSRPPTLRLDSKETRAIGSGGCNRFSGDYELAGARLTLGPLLSTKMACEPGMELEMRYFEALGRVDAWRIEDGELVLRGQGAALRFRPAS